MDISDALLVALMFVGLVSIAIGNIVMGLTAIFERRSQLSFYWIHLSWVILLLLLCFELFWNTVEIFSMEDWEFSGFLYMILGPILLTFAGQSVMPDLSSPESSDLRLHYFKVSREFFLLLALVELWIIGVDIVLGKGLTAAHGINGAILALLLAMAFNKQASVHSFATVAAWILLVLSLAFLA